MKTRYESFGFRFLVFLVVFERFVLGEIERKSLRSRRVIEEKEMINLLKI